MPKKSKINEYSDIYEVLRPIIIYVQERYYFPQMCTFRKDVKKFEVKVGVQKGPLMFTEFFDNRCVSFIQFTLTIVVIW